MTQDKLSPKYSGRFNDYIKASGENNTYIFYNGHGQDVVVDRSGSNTIEMKDVNFADVKFTTSWGSLTMYGYNGTDSITFQRDPIYDENPLHYMPAKFIFKDQTVTWAQLSQNLVLHGSDANDQMWMYDGAMYVFGVPVTMYGGNGNDSLAGSSYYNDTLYGEVGNDSLSGWGGDDRLEGGAGNDSLGGGAGTDTLIGGTGDDVLNGGDGDDTFYFNLNEGVDNIVASAGNDTVVFAHLLGFQNLFYSRNNLSLTIGIDGGNSVTIDNYNTLFSSTTSGSIVLGDGTTINQAMVNQMIQGMASDGSEIRNAAEWISPTPNNALTIASI